MTRQTKLQKLIEIAAENGWDLFYEERVEYKNFEWYVSRDKFYYTRSYNTHPDEYSFFDVLFSHDFAKAIWGEEQHRFGRNIVGTLKEWEWRIQEAVISDDPLEYYWKNKLKKEAS